MGSLLALVLVTTPVIATETWREYDSWQNRPLGILEVLFGIAHKDLPPMPDWKCNKSNPPRLLDGELPIALLYVADVEDPFTESEWESHLSQRLGVPVNVQPEGRTASLEEARAHAMQNRDRTHLVLRDGYFRGENLNEKIEGMACGNVAITNVNAECQEGVAAHEVGHVLGISHSHGGLMRARAAACPATLNADQVGYLTSHAKTSTTAGLEF